MSKLYRKALIATVLLTALAGSAARANVLF